MKKNRIFPFRLLRGRIILALLFCGAAVTLAALSVQTPVASGDAVNTATPLASTAAAKSILPSAASSGSSSAGQCELLRSPADDAPNTALGGDGSNVDNLDLIGVTVKPDPAALFDVILQLENLSQTLPLNAAHLIWYFQWTTNYNTPNPSYYYAGASFPSADPSAPPGTVDFTVGTYNPGTGAYTSVAFTTGTFNPGPGGTISIVIPNNALSGVTTGSLISQTYATSWIGEGAAGADVIYQIDIAPKPQPQLQFGALWFGNNYIAGAGCNATSISGTWVPVAGAAPYPRQSIGMAYDESMRSVLMFGGGHSSETWLWDGAQWTQLAPSPAPIGRFGPSMAYDPRSQTVLMFGGQAVEGADYGTELNDTWLWNGSTRKWTQLHPAHSPSPRQWAGMAYDGATSQMVLFGGDEIGVTSLADTWIWDGNDWVEQIAVGPPPRFGQGMAYDAARAELVMFGGCCDQNDTWVWIGSTWEPRSPATKPDARDGAAMAYHAASGKVVLFSGDNSVADTWTWDGTNWQQESPSNAPPTRFFPGATYDVARQVMMIFGGNGRGPSGPTLLQDQWNWTGSNWQQVVTEAPDARLEPAFAYDPAHDEYVLFGGTVTSLDFQTYTDTNETWTFHGTHWTRKFPPNSPPPQRHAQMVYDSELGKIVLVSLCNPCSDSSNPLAETWTWDGSNWTKLNLAVNPPERWAEALAWDPATSSLVMFGGLGFCSTCGPLNDTWIFKEGTWIQLQPAHVPSPRLESAFTWDPQLGRMLLFSGRGSVGFAGDPHRFDTWVWDGTDWTQLTPPLSPVQRELSRAVIDSRSDLTILFGGFYSVELGDTWVWRDGEWVQVHPGAMPQPRYGFGLAESSSFSGPMLFGGEFSGQFRNDLWTFVSGITPTSVFSRKTHGSITPPFDINLPLSGTRGIESRGTGTTNNTYTLIFTFSNNLTSVASASVTGHDPESGTGSVSTSEMGPLPNQYAVNLTGVSTGQYITVTLNSVVDAVGNSGNVLGPQMGVLVGDINFNGTTNNTDVGLVKAEVTAPVDGTNFRNDVNASGTVNNTDVGITKANVSAQLP